MLPLFSLICSLIYLNATGIVASEDAVIVKVLSESVTSEEAAFEAMGPILKDTKKMDMTDLDFVIRNQWWDLAEKLIVNAHIAGVDTSQLITHVRAASMEVKKKGEELVRNLDPGYGHIQDVVPAFMWAQNDTTVFVTFKYSMRWQAPGSPNIDDLDANLTSTNFNFTGIGSHSGNRYRYGLNLDFFDHIVKEKSSYNTASVGKMSLTMRKKIVRRWPRLLADENVVFENGLLWIDRQEQLDPTLQRSPLGKASAPSCKLEEKFYCLDQDRCLALNEKNETATCDECSRNILDKENGNCGGNPYMRVKPEFKDMDKRRGRIAGKIHIKAKAFEEPDFDSYVVQWAYNETDYANDLEPLMEVPAIGGETYGELVTEYQTNWEEAEKKNVTHIAIRAKNIYGMSESGNAVLVEDRYVPDAVVPKALFVDTDGRRNYLAGDILWEPVLENDDPLLKTYGYEFHWGKSPTKKIGGKKTQFHQMGASEDFKYHLKETQIPLDATHILIYIKNKHYPAKKAFPIEIVDNVAPCGKNRLVSCPKKVEMGDDLDGEKNKLAVDVIFHRAMNETRVDHYEVYTGTTSECKNKRRNLKTIYLPDGAERYQRTWEKEWQRKLDKIRLQKKQENLDEKLKEYQEYNETGYLKHNETQDKTLIDIEEKKEEVVKQRDEAWDKLVKEQEEAREAYKTNHNLTAVLSDEEMERRKQNTIEWADNRFTQLDEEAAKVSEKVTKGLAADHKKFSKELEKARNEVDNYSKSWEREDTKLQEIKDSIASMEYIGDEKIKFRLDVASIRNDEKFLVFFSANEAVRMKYDGGCTALPIKDYIDAELTRQREEERKQKAEEEKERKKQLKEEEAAKKKAEEEAAKEAEADADSDEEDDEEEEEPVDSHLIEEL